MTGKLSLGPRLPRPSSPELAQFGDAPWDSPVAEGTTQGECALKGLVTRMTRAVPSEGMTEPLRP